MRKFFSLLLPTLAVCLLLAGCGEKLPKPPEFYEIGENSVISLDQFMGAATGTLIQIDKPSEETPDQYIYHYDQVLDVPHLVKTYYEHLLLPEQGFTLTDDTYLPLAEPASFDGLTSELILVRPAVEEKKLFRLVIGWTVEQVCTVNVACIEGAIRQPPKEEPEKAPEPATLVEQIDHMYTYTPAVLGLEGNDLSGYKIFPVEGIMSVDNKACRQFNVYQVREEDQVCVIAGTYLLTLDLQSLYHLDLTTDGVCLLQ